MEFDRIAFGNRLKKARKEKGLTSNALAELADTSPVYIRQIESASRVPRLKLLTKICNALSVSPDFLLADSLEKNRLEQRDEICKKLHFLSPKQVEFTNAMIDTILDKLR